jgi:hypothetical protein
MAQLKWLGEDELHDGVAGPSFTTAFGGIKFPKGEAVEVQDEEIVAKARKNQYFAVSDNVEPASEADDGGAIGDPRWRQPWPAHPKGEAVEQPVKRKPGRPRKDETADVED